MVEGEVSQKGNALQMGKAQTFRSLHVGVQKVKIWLENSIIGSTKTVSHHTEVTLSHRNFVTLVANYF